MELEIKMRTAKLMLVPIFLLSLLQTNRTFASASGCQVTSPDSDNAPLFIQMLNEYETVLMPKADTNFVLKTNIVIFALCPGGFADDNTKTIVKLKCVGDALMELHDKQDPISFTGELKCATSDKSELFEKSSEEECSKTNFAIGLNISGQIITFAESCYDTHAEQIEYVHYRATRPSQFLSSYIPEIFLLSTIGDVRSWDKTNPLYVDRQHIFNKQVQARIRRSVDTTDPRFIDQKRTFDEQINSRVKRYLDTLDKNQRISKREIESITNLFIYKSIQDVIAKVYKKSTYISHMHNYDSIAQKLCESLNGNADYLDYKEANLFPPDTYAPFVLNPFENRDFLQQYYGWNSLVLGNWQHLHEMIILQSHKETFEVYNGFSGTMEIPANSQFNCLMEIYNDTHGIKIESDEKEDVILKIPKYLWTYVKNFDKAKSFVAIGTNSPYFQSFPDALSNCQDVCSIAPWLSKLEKFRHYPTFGLVRCCSVMEVKDFLDGFPKID